MFNGTSKVLCSCQSEFQDKTHGKNVRVANATQRKAPDGYVAVKCTVCGKEHTVAKSRVK